MHFYYQGDSPGLLDREHHGGVAGASEPRRLKYQAGDSWRRTRLYFGSNHIQWRLWKIWGYSYTKFEINLNFSEPEVLPFWKIFLKFREKWMRKGTRRKKLKWRLPTGGLRSMENNKWAQNSTFRRVSSRKNSPSRMVSNRKQSVATYNQMGLSSSRPAGTELRCWLDSTLNMYWDFYFLNKKFPALSHRKLLDVDTSTNFFSSDRRLILRYKIPSIVTRTIH